jgi:hypothetical protein
MSDPRYSLAFRLCRLIKFQAHHCNAVSVVFVQNITQEAQFRFPVRGFTFMLQCLPKQGSMHPTNSFINKALKTFPWYTKSISMYCRRHGGTPVASTQQTPYYSEIRRFKERGRYRRKTEKENDGQQSEQNHLCNTATLPLQENAHVRTTKWSP